MVQERAVAVGGGLEARHEVGEQLHVEDVDLRDLLDPLRVVAVVGQRVMGVAHPDLRVGLEAALAADHHRADAGEVGLEGDDLQVVHQLDVVGEEHGDAVGLLHRGSMSLIPCLY
jgi:hypothetical protein